MARSRSRQPPAQTQQRQTPTASPPVTFHNRVMPPVRNPVYNYNTSANFKRTPQPTHALERPSRHQTQPGVDPRLTVMGDQSRATDLTPVMGMAYQTPLNVWELFPA